MPGGPSLSFDRARSAPQEVQFAAWPPGDAMSNAAAATGSVQMPLGKHLRGRAS